MTSEELMERLSEFFAYDTCGSSFGVKDDNSKNKVFEYIKAIDEDKRRALMGRIGRELYLSDEALELGYGLEDMREFINWLDDEMGLYF